MREKKNKNDNINSDKHMQFLFDYLAQSVCYICVQVFTFSIPDLPLTKSWAGQTSKLSVTWDRVDNKQSGTCNIRPGFCQFPRSLVCNARIGHRHRIWWRGDYIQSSVVVSRVYYCFTDSDVGYSVLPFILCSLYITFVTFIIISALHACRCILLCLLPFLPALCLSFQIFKTSNNFILLLHLLFSPTVPLYLPKCLSSNHYLSKYVRSGSFSTSSFCNRFLVSPIRSTKSSFVICPFNLRKCSP